MPLLFEKLSYLTDTLRNYIYRDPLPLTEWNVCDKLPYGTPRPPNSDPQWRTLADGEFWGARLTWAWLRTRVTVPAHMAHKPLALHVVFATRSNHPSASMFSSPEAMVTVPGLDVPPQALNSAHHEVVLSDQLPAGQPLDIILEMFGGVSQPGDHQIQFKIADLVWIDRDVDGLYWDARVLLDTIATLPPVAPECDSYLRVLDEAFRHINWLNPGDEAFCASVREARAILQDRIFQHTPLSGGVAQRPVVHAVGHAHIDVAWLWPLNVTRGKAARTFATALALMEQFPSYRFTQSQPHLYKMVAEDDPGLFQRIKDKIASGQWNATGGTWVEPDTNLPNGESLARQFLYGMRFFERELGVRPQVLWLPDVFGYCAALPQIMRLADIRYFYTTKLSWNQYNRMPYDTFWWEGLDGSRVLAHLGTTPDLGVETQGIRRATYNGAMLPVEVFRTWAEYQQKDANHHLITSYGIGDGGGGPNRDMIERMERMADLPGLPQVTPGTAENFFHALQDTVPDDLPRWAGELYFELHRGTYTSQARTKRNNRKTEVALHNAEALASVAYLLGTPYPHEDLNTAWETLLLNQFHDILPGSSINEVYQDADRDYAKAQARTSAVIHRSLEEIAQHIRYDYGMHGFAVFNTLGITQGGPVEVILQDDGPVEIVGPSGRPKAFQWIDERARHALMLVNSVPAYGHTAYVVRPAENASPLPVENAVSATPTHLENSLLRVDFDERGNLIRLYDRENLRDVLAPGEIGNQLWAYVDRPHSWDAWDVEVYVQDQGWRLEPDSVRLVEHGPIRATLEVTYTFNRSRIVQRISLLAGQRLLVFDTDVDWHEQHILLRTHFPLAIRTLAATYEVQYGTVERPTHRNTSWDVARHEVPAQQWADMSEGHYGVALINDCKYGYSAHDHVLTLSLLRSTTHPDLQADQGSHTFTYALYPHPGDWRQGVITQARRLNTPLLTQPVQAGGTWLPVEFGLVQCPTRSVVIDTVKKAEDSDALIVRVYEAHGGRTPVSLVFASQIESAEEVNLLEEPLGKVDVMVDTLRFALTPYQVRSFRVRLSSLLEQQLG